MDESEGFNQSIKMHQGILPAAHSIIIIVSLLLI
jgi:hypothetical protein